MTDLIPEIRVSVTGIKASEGCPANPAWQGLAGAEEGQEKLLESCFSNWPVRVEWRFGRLDKNCSLCEREQSQVDYEHFSLGWGVLCSFWLHSWTCPPLQWGDAQAGGEGL